jgi:hypothetical protein
MAKAVLVVDDNAAIRCVLCELFQNQADFQVCGEAENGKEAIDRAWELHPDLIVIDLSMPVMNGLDASACAETQDAYGTTDYVQRIWGRILRAGSPVRRNFGVNLKIGAYLCAGRKSSQPPLPRCCLITSSPNQEIPESHA